MRLLGTVGRNQAWFLPVTLALFIAACAGQSSPADSSEGVCNRALQLDRDVLYETLDVGEIRQELDLLKADLTKASGPRKEAGSKFVRAASEILAGGFYDYPTFQVLSYLDTYEHMELHVAAFEAVEELRDACGSAKAKSG